SPLALAWSGAFLSEHSLGLVNRQLCRRLLERGHHLSLQPVPSLGEEIEPGPLRELLTSRFGAALPRPAEVTVRLAWPPDWTAPPCGRGVVCRPGGLGAIPRDWLAPLRERVEEVGVPPASVRAGFVRSGVPAHKVQVVPLGADHELFRPGFPTLPLPTEKSVK